MTPSSRAAQPAGRPALLTLGLLTAIAVAPPLDAQSHCGLDGRWAVLEAGPVRYPLAAGMDGVEVGVDAALAAPPASLRVGYRAVALGDRRATPHLLRATARRGVAELIGIELCATGHLGASLVASRGDRVSTGVAGLGLAAARTVELANGTLVPFLEGRGLAAASGGSVLDMGVGASGLSLGVEAGFVAGLGRALFAITGSADGFAAGLGVTPHPELAARVALGYRF